MRIKQLLTEYSTDYVFRNPDTGGDLVADVFIPEAGIVIMEPAAPVTPEELVEVTFFHINNRRRIVWVVSGEEEWVREAFAAGPNLRAHSKWYSVCIYRDQDDDAVRRVVDADEAFERLELSAHQILIEKGMDVEDFFREEQYWENRKGAPEEWGLSDLIASGTKANGTLS